MGLFPSLDYKGLYNSIIPLIEVAPLIPYGIKGKYAVLTHTNHGVPILFMFFQHKRGGFKIIYPQ